MPKGKFHILLANPNLYLFNCVLHLDEATPHLHIDYIPMAKGYKKGMGTRNSISKALQHMRLKKVKAGMTMRLLTGRQESVII